ncbi:DNA-binding protein D-ETS-4 isoform X1 [Musca domestica]|uniref:DNA-binding protein D-ETS-4 isoform X1 n=2 Tax=Musca domestica TaxID=7370 RepID=A0ABM3V9Q6_MUSDO|nr:DNA-binding protein D-ETS-4 isoform X1 [Musca domestica]
MENGEKMFSFTATASNSSLKMPQTGCLVVQNPPSISTASVPVQSNFNFKLELQQEEQQHFSAANNSTATTTTTNDPYATYTDNFDLSLLPQDCCADTATNTTKAEPQSSSHVPAVTNAPHSSTNLIDSIPTTVFNFDKTATDHTNTQLLTVPDIKVEQTWSSCPSLNTIKQEQIYQSYFPANNQQQQRQQQQQQLIAPPPAYPAHIYPSPQSSPAQSEYAFPQTQFSGCYESLGSSHNSLYGTACSPCPSIKQEQLHILPPSPPESSCDTPTPHSASSSASSSVGFDFKSEPFDSDVETFQDLKNSPSNRTDTTVPSNRAQVSAQRHFQCPTDHQVLREYLEDTTFQRKHNLKPLALDSFIGALEEVRDNFEPVISLALEHAKREADAICAKLQISQDPSDWTPQQVHAWLRSTIQQFDLPIIENLENKFNESGAALLQLTEEEFVRRIPEGGEKLHAQLEIWKLTHSDNYHLNSINSCAHQQMWTQNSMPALYSQDMEEDTEDEDDFLPNDNHTPSTGNNLNGQYMNNEGATTNGGGGAGTNQMVPTIKRAGARNGGSHIHLWQFLKELLSAPHINGTAIRWIDRSKGIFKIEDSVRVAKLWGKRKNRPAMNYDKLSRSIRQYYKKGIMKKTERSQRLVYQFCQPYHM